MLAQRNLNFKKILRTNYWIIRTMANGWTLKRRKRQSILIHSWDPSASSTGPRTDMGKARSSLNALKHGARAKCFKETLGSFEKILQLQESIQIRIKEKISD